MLRFFQQTTKQVAISTGSVLATTIVANATYQLGVFAYNSIKRPPLQNSLKPEYQSLATSAGNLDTDDSADRVATGSLGLR